MKSIDVHAHILPDCFMKAVREGRLDGVSVVPLDNGGEKLMFGKAPHPLNPLFYDTKAQLDWLDANGIDQQYIAIGPRLFFYERSLEFAIPFCRECNDEILARCASSNGRLLPVGTVPLQSVEASIAEVEYLASKGVRLIQIGTTVNDLNLDDPSLLPFYRCVAEKGIVLLLHPHIENLNIRTKQHHLGNIVGNPFQTTAAAFNLIAGGVFDAVPELQILLVHGGGYVTQQIGRLDHGYEVRPKGEYLCSHKPSWYLRKNFLFDSLLFDPMQIEHLVKVAGNDRVVFGTDYPYDMTDAGSYRGLEDQKLASLIGSENTERIFGH